MPLSLSPSNSDGWITAGGRALVDSFKNWRPKTRISDDRDTKRVRCSGGRLMADFSKSLQNIKAVAWASGLRESTIWRSESTAFSTYEEVRTSDNSDDNIHTSYSPTCVFNTFMNSHNFSYVSFALSTQERSG